MMNCNCEEQGRKILRVKELRRCEEPSSNILSDSKEETGETAKRGSAIVRGKKL